MSSLIRCVTSSSGLSASLQGLLKLRTVKQVPKAMWLRTVTELEDLRVFKATVIP